MKKISYNEPNFGEEEVSAVVSTLNNKWLTAGKNCEEFTQKISELFGKKYGVMVNSGSSANLLALISLDLPKGTEIITPILTFATTLSPIVLLGYKPVFVDCEVGYYLPTADAIKEKITEKTSAVFIPNLIGNLPEYKKIRQICNEKKIVLVEDSCDTLGHKAYGDIVTTSFYATHVITACGAGGVVMTDDEKIAKKLRSMRDWGRGIDDNEDIDARYSYQLDDIPYDAKFVYVNMPFNFKPIEPMGAFGLVQLKKLESFLQIRRRYFEELVNFFSEFEEFITPKEFEKSNWLNFPLMLSETAKFDRLTLVKWLEAKNIQTRPIFSGNVLRQPFFKAEASGFPKADMIMKNGLAFGIHQSLTNDEITYIKDVFKEFLIINK